MAVQRAYGTRKTQNQIVSNSLGSKANYFLIDTAEIKTL